MDFRSRGESNLKNEEAKKAGIKEAAIVEETFFDDMISGEQMQLKTMKPLSCS